MLLVDGVYTTPSTVHRPPYTVHAPRRRARPGPNPRPRHHSSFPDSAHWRGTATLRFASHAHWLIPSSPSCSCTGPTLAGSKLHHDDREMSALGPVTDRPVSMPILLRQRRSVGRSVGCFTFLRSRSSWSPASASSASGRKPPPHPGATWCRWGFNTSRSRRGSRWSPLPLSLSRCSASTCSATGCGTCSIRNHTSESCRYGSKPRRLLPARSRSFLPESDGGRHQPRPPPMSVCSVRGDGMPRTGPRGA